MRHSYVGALAVPVFSKNQISLRIFLHEQIEVAVGVDVDELRPWHVEAAEERQIERPAGFVGDGKRHDHARERARLNGCLATGQVAASTSAPCQTK